jgi:ABC-2 type transport system ATP-binding protein
MGANNTMDRPSVERASLGSPAISVRGVTKRFGSVTAVHDLSLEVHPGVVTGFLGPNGAGKSTTLRIVLGLVAPTEGTATVLGMPYRSLREPTKTVGAVLETQSFNPLRSGRNHLRVLASASGIPRRRVDEILELVGLEAAARRNAGTYSLGMRQRLALGAALLGDPRILILDEPANGLDPAGVHEFRSICRDLADAGTAVFLSSHLLSDIEKSCDRVVILKGGRVIADGTLAELGAGDPWIHLKVDPADAFRAAALLADLSPREQGPGELLVRAQSGKLVGKLLLDGGIVPEGIGQKEPTLEELFLALTEDR